MLLILEEYWDISANLKSADAEILAKLANYFSLLTALISHLFTKMSA